MPWRDVESDGDLVDAQQAGDEPGGNEPVWAHRPSPVRSRRDASIAAWSADFPPTPVAPSLARRAIEPLAAHLDPEAMENARLLVSELVTNAVLYAGDEPRAIELEAHVLPEAVVVSVANYGRGFDPDRLLRSRPEAPGGRGLELVAALADALGIDGREPFRVWFSLRR